MCATDYYGSKCDRFCQPMSNSIGHFKCTDNGTLICENGWEGRLCDTGQQIFFFFNYNIKVKSIKNEKILLLLFNDSDSSMIYLI